jgi:Ethanolamine utilization protein EutJ (predicted chaperonin)
VFSKHHRRIWALIVRAGIVVGILAQLSKVVEEIGTLSAKDLTNLILGELFSDAHTPVPPGASGDSLSSAQVALVFREPKVALDVASAFDTPYGRRVKSLEVV